MKRHTWTAKQLRILINEYPFVKNTCDLAKKIGKPYSALRSRVKVLKLHRQAPKVGVSYATAEELKYIKKNYLKLPLTTIAGNLGNGRSYNFVKSRMDAMGLIRPPELIKKIKEATLTKKGNIPPNKGKKQKDYMSPASIEKAAATRFKKGQPSNNELFDGAIVTRRKHKQPTDKPHKHIRISKNVWQELQIFNWEKKNGPVPKGFILACKDGDTLNCKPSNWFLITRADNAIRNSGSINLSDGYVAHLLAGKKHKDIKAELLKYPELIALKRKTIILTRKLKTTG